MSCSATSGTMLTRWSPLEVMLSGLKPSCSTPSSSPTATPALAGGNASFCSSGADAMVQALECQPIFLLQGFKLGEIRGGKS
mmetsp:Transcript_115654/g.274876  ORF Transcript_115654/g.274876 Transcript_115654/m.274876 type:complete len:82 (-) Transcript_115654:9-254(-)